MASQNPVPFKTPVIDKRGMITQPWQNFFSQILTGVSQGPLTNPMDSVGDMIYGGIQGAASKLPGNKTATRKFLAQTGNGANSSQPNWGVLLSDDIPNNASNTTGSAESLTQDTTDFALVIGAGPESGITDLGVLGTVGQSLYSQGPGLPPIWNDVVNSGALAIYGTRPAPVLITASGGIATNLDQRQLIRIKGTGGAVTITNTTPIAAGSIDGQELILEGSSSSNTVTINPGTGLEFGGTMELGTGDKLGFIWNAAAGVWTETFRFLAGIAGGIFTDDSGNPFTDNSGNTFGNG